MFTLPNSTRALLLLDASLTLSLQTVCSIAMLTHVTDRAVPQILVLAIALMLAIELSIFRSRRSRR